MHHNTDPRLPGSEARLLRLRSLAAHCLLACAVSVDDLIVVPKTPMITNSNLNGDGNLIWYPFKPSVRFLFRGVGAVYIIALVLTFFIEGRFSILGCLLAAMFFAWDFERVPKTLANRIGGALHWLIGIFFLGLGLMSIWLLFFPIAPK